MSYTYICNVDGAVDHFILTTHTFPMVDDSLTHTSSQPTDIKDWWQSALTLQLLTKLWYVHVI